MYRGRVPTCSYPGGYLADAIRATAVRTQARQLMGPDVAGQLSRPDDDYDGSLADDLAGLRWGPNDPAAQRRRDIEKKRALGRRPSRNPLPGVVMDDNR